MRRRSGLQGLLGLVFAAVVLGSCLGRPPMTLTLNGSTATVDVQTLGEYPTTVTRIRLQESQSKMIVWEVVAAEGDTLQVRRVRLSAGANPISAVEDTHGSYVVTVPRGAETFELRPGTEYEIVISGNKHPWSRASQRFTLGP